MPTQVLSHNLVYDYDVDGAPLDGTSLCSTQPEQQYTATLPSLKQSLWGPCVGQTGLRSYKRQILS